MLSHCTNIHPLLHQKKRNKNHQSFELFFWTLGASLALTLMMMMMMVMMMIINIKFSLYFSFSPHFWKNVKKKFCFEINREKKQNNGKKPVVASPGRMSQEFEWHFCYKKKRQTHGERWCKLNKSFNNEQRLALSLSLFVSLFLPVFPFLLPLPGHSLYNSWRELAAFTCSHLKTQLSFFLLAFWIALCCRAMACGFWVVFASSSSLLCLVIILSVSLSLLFLYQYCLKFDRQPDTDATRV